ncbi:MAG: hypothetical protein NTV93_12390 [Verrucomicrobia bacterium]|nr:hypothetical protein [Verrucomicrobiota bacterium]
MRPNNPLLNRVSADAGDSPGEWLDKKPIAGLLPCLGPPITHSGPSPWLFLSGDDVLGLDDAELDALLRRGAVLDAKAAEALALRGQAERIGVRVGDPIPLDDLGFEEFVDPGISPRLHGRFFPLRPLVADGDWRLLKDITGRGRAASVIRNFRRTEIGPALLLTENQAGERFAVLAFAGQGDRHLIENLMRGEEFRETFAWVARRPLPLTMSHGAPYLWTILNRTLDDRLVMGIVNLSTDTYDALPVQVAPDAMPGRIHRLNETGRLEETPLEAEWDSQGRCLLPCRLAPMELAVLIFEGIEWQSPLPQPRTPPGLAV